MKKEVNTVIIGAGICGLSAAHFLSKKRSDFLILEASNLPGGIIKTKIENDFICENGPNTVLLNNNAIEKIIIYGKNFSFQKRLAIKIVLFYTKID